MSSSSRTMFKCQLFMYLGWIFCNYLNYCYLNLMIFENSFLLNSLRSIISNYTHSSQYSNRFAYWNRKLLEIVWRVRRASTWRIPYCSFAEIQPAPNVLSVVHIYQHAFFISFSRLSLIDCTSTLTHHSDWSSFHLFYSIKMGRSLLNKYVCVVWKNTNWQHQILYVN